VRLSIGVEIEEIRRTISMVNLNYLLGQTMDLVHPSPDGTPASTATPVTEVRTVKNKKQWREVPLYGGVNFIEGDIFKPKTLVIRFFTTFNFQIIMVLISLCGFLFTDDRTPLTLSISTISDFNRSCKGASLESLTEAYTPTFLFLIDLSIELRCLWHRRQSRAITAT
jgi:hypothetical protein